MVRQMEESLVTFYLLVKSKIAYYMSLLIKISE